MILFEQHPRNSRPDISRQFSNAWFSLPACCLKCKVFFNPFVNFAAYSDRHGFYRTSIIYRDNTIILRRAPSCDAKTVYNRQQDNNRMGVPLLYRDDLCPDKPHGPGYVFIPLPRIHLRTPALAIHPAHDQTRIKILSMECSPLHSLYCLLHSLCYISRRANPG